MTSATPDVPSANPWRRVLWLAVGLLLLLPLAAMAFTAEMNWGAGDFVAAAALLVGAGVAIEIAVRLFRRRRTRLLATLAILAAVALVWADAAVGVF